MPAGLNFASGKNAAQIVSPLLEESTPSMLIVALETFFVKKAQL